MRVTRGLGVELTIVCAMLIFNVMFIGFYETVLKQVLGGHKDQSYQKKYCT